MKKMKQDSKKLERFIALCSDHQLFEKFIKNFLKQFPHYEGCIEKGIDAHLQRHPRAFFGTAFQWAETPEGYAYWLEVETAWHKYIK